MINYSSLNLAQVCHSTMKEEPRIALHALRHLLDVVAGTFSDLTGLADDARCWLQSGLPSCALRLLSLTQFGRRP